MAQILAPGTAAANSSEFTLAAGEAATLSLFCADGFLPAMQGNFFHVEKKASNNTWMRTGVMLTGDEPSVVLSGVGVFRVARPALSVTEAVGVDKD